MHHPDMKALRTAIPYIRIYQDRIVVAKLGGRLCRPGRVLDHLVEQFSLLAALGIRLVIVHGGGEQLSDLARRMGLEPQIVLGRRITDAGTLELAKMTFAGVVNTDLIAAFRGFDIPAIGLTGVDGGLIQVVRRPPQMLNDPASGEQRQVDFGFVGDIVATRTEVLSYLLEKRIVPVIGCLAADAQGAVYNVNADTVAARLAVDLKAIKYVLLTGVDGILRDIDDPRTLLSHLELEDLERLIAQGVIRDGMLPKVRACAEALRGGVPRVHIVNGQTPDALLAELFTNEGSGTLIVASRGADKAAVPP